MIEPFTFRLHEFIMMRFSYIQIMISISNWTEWSTIQGVIARVISKSVEREARGRFENTSAITPWIVLHEVQSLIYRIYNKMSFGKFFS